MAETPACDPWTALFTNRSLRVAWLTAVLVLTAANLFVPSGRAEGLGPIRSLDPEVAAIGRFPGLGGPDLPGIRENGLEGDRL